MKNWNQLGEDLKERLMEDYRIEVWENKKQELYMIEPATNSGFLVKRDGEVVVMLSGVSYEQYYHPDTLKVNVKTDVKKVYESLVKKEKLNKDRLRNVMIFLEDIATRDRINKQSRIDV